MNTLAEIKAAVESLPHDKKEELLRFLVARLRNGAVPHSEHVTLARSQRGFPISKGRMPFTSAEVGRMEVESDATL